MNSPTPSRSLRIGELAAKVGTTTHLLRAWESRYSLLRPTRTVGGYRRYGREDERRVRAMLALRARGVAAHTAAAEVLSADRRQVEPDARGRVGAVGGDLVVRLGDRLTAFDEAGAHALLDEVFRDLSVESAITDVLMPCLHALGDGWAQGELDVAQEHFASHLIRVRLGALAVGSPKPDAPRVVLACPQGEQHDLGLLALAVVLGRAGWGTCFLGADTPVADLVSACAAVRPALVVVAGRDPDVLRVQRRPLGALATTTSLVLAGPAASARLAAAIGAVCVPGDPVQAAQRLSELHRTQQPPHV